MGSYFADLHIHSKYSRACSQTLDIANLEKYARVKGINLLGTGDFTHPKWIEEIRANLSEHETGIYRTKTGFPFVLQTEISLMYSQGGKGRKVHLVVLAPNLDAVGQITEYLKSKGRVDYDGRPIFGIPCPEFVERMKQISDDIEIIPSHAWTPWFGLFGSKSGFDSVRECFQDKTKHIYALETGLSSDPSMNWMLSSLDKYTLVSNSDLHSYWPWRLGRECNHIELKELTYKNLINAIRTKKGFVETIEFWPDEGKYHYDGHRGCGIVFSPEESEKHNNICPVCRRPLTIGVMNRVRELADREPGKRPEDAVPFRNLIPLSELIAKKLGTAVSTKKVWEEYYKIMKPYKSEYDVLLNAEKEQLEKLTHPKIAEIIVMNRGSGIKWRPGYDGVYGEPIIEPIENKSDRESGIENRELKTDSLFQKGWRKEAHSDELNALKTGNRIRANRPYQPIAGSDKLNPLKTEDRELKTDNRIRANRPYQPIAGSDKLNPLKTEDRELKTGNRKPRAGKQKSLAEF